MTKDKSLIWRLKELPTGDEVAQLVEQGVVTKQEARELLFKESLEQDKDIEVKALTEQVKFLEKIVDQLSKGGVNGVSYTPVYPTRYWVNTPWITCTTSSTSTNSPPTVSYKIK